MSEFDDIPGAAVSSARKKEQSIDVRPTLFIGIGGTGMEVLLRMRRRILNTSWGNDGAKVRIDNLTQFPIAQFIHFDLDAGAVLESNRSQADDLQQALVRFSDEDRLVEAFDLEGYCRDEDSLDKYPLIKAWLPLTPQKIRSLGIDPSKGAGQIRAISRLYFFDKYLKLRDKIRQKLHRLSASLTNAQPLQRLGLKMQPGECRIVVVGSVAGGTGSGAFIDVGLLAGALAHELQQKCSVELLLFLPTGFANANKDRTQANGYAALMELEPAMLDARGFVQRWDADELMVLPRSPYNEVYLIDSGNLAQERTQQLDDVYHMVADALFEDFAAGDFARKKRSVAVNQQQHKNHLYHALVPQGRYGDMKLGFARRYSAFGQAVLDTRQEAQREECAHRWAQDMLRAFFGVGVEDLAANRASDRQRDEFLADRLSLRPVPFTELPTFSDPSIKLQHSSGEFTDYVLVDELLQDRQGSLLAGVEQRVSQRMDEIRSGYARKEWPAQVRDALRQLERDAVRDQDSTADTTEDRVVRRRRERLEGMKGAVREQLYAYLDDKDYGGLEYVLTLVEQVKDRIEAAGTGLADALRNNARRYREIKEAVRTREFERLLNHLEQVRGGIIFNGAEKQALLVMEQLRVEMANGIKFHLRAKAADEAAQLLGEFSNWLGSQSGTDSQGRALWNGLVGEFQVGRTAVQEMLEQLQRDNAILRQDLRRDHATLITVPAPKREPARPELGMLRQWADEAFKDLGGSRALFPMLQDAQQREQLLGKVLRMAQRQIAQRADLGMEETDPLVEGLQSLDAHTRQERFRKLLSCAMPWIEANLGGDFKTSGDQFKCFIGVANRAEFESRFGGEIRSVVPTQAGIGASQVDIVETGVPGRAVCYCELSGVPLTVLRGLEVWRTSYRKENDKTPVHAHLDITQFRHPIAPTPEELASLASDFRLFLQAVMLGVLVRSPQRLMPPGQYQYEKAPGDTRRIGNERAVRLNGLPSMHREAIAVQVEARLTEADGNVLAALAVLCSFYAFSVYTPRLEADATGSEVDIKGFAHVMARDLATETARKAQARGVTGSSWTDVEKRLTETLGTWSEAVPDSDADAYPWEVRELKEGDAPRVKRVLRMQGLAQRLEGLLKPPASVASVPPLPGAPAPAPLVQQQYAYFLAAQGQRIGPLEMAPAQLLQMLQAGMVSPEAKVWRQGLAGWVVPREVPELAALMLPPLPGTSEPPPLP